MAIPFRRTSKTRKAKRRTHQVATKPTYTVCSNCGSTVKPHTVCTSCGYYKDKKVLKLDEE